MGVSSLSNIEVFISLIKQHALAAVSASNPLEVRYGTVVNENPLKINVDQKMTLEMAHLELTRNVTDYETEISIGGSGKQSCTVYNKLKNGEKVMLLRKQGGGKYIVLDRV